MVVRANHLVTPTVRMIAAMAAAAALLCACGSEPAAPTQRLSVVASNFPIAQMVAMVGGNRVKVTDLSKGADDDRTVVPSAAQKAAMGSAALIVEVGGGYQPAVEKAAGTGSRVLALRGPAGGPTAQFWLDFAAMKRASVAVQSELTKLDGAGKSVYANGEESFASVLSTLSIDYQDTLSDCPYNVVVAPDDAFEPLLAASVLKVLVVGATAPPALTDHAAAIIRNQSIPTIFSEPPLDDSRIADLSHETGAKVRPIDTLDGPPLPPEPANYSYFNRMEANLGWIAEGLRCSAASAGNQ